MESLIRDPQTQVAALVGLAALVGAAAGWFLAMFRTAARTHHAEMRIEELRQGNQALNQSMNRLQQTASQTTELNTHIELSETAIEEMRDALSEATELRKDAESTTRARQEEIERLGDKLKTLAEDRTAIQEQLAASRRAHEDLTNRYLELEARAKTGAHRRPATHQAPEPVVEAVAAAAASSIRDVESASNEMTRPLDEVAGVRETARLEAMGLRTNVDLVRKCGMAAGLEVVAASTGIPQSRLRRWTSIADLTRVNGLDTEAAAALHEAGINSIQTLAGTAAKDMAKRLKQAGADQEIANPDVLSQWIAAARLLEPLLKA